MNLDNDIALTIIMVTLTMALFIGLVVLLLVLNQQRRTKHRAELAEVRVQHAEEVRAVEKEVMNATLAEVGRDLHDNIGQLLTVARMGVMQLAKSAPNEPRAPQVKETLDNTIAEVRRLSKTLMADRWNELSLADAIREECERVQRNGPVLVQFTSAGHEPVVSPDQKLVLFRIFQEAMNNALKHAGTKRIAVALGDGDGVHLSVADDGGGFDVEERMANNAGQGLRNMVRRAELIGYHCQVSSRIVAGTTVSLTPHGPENSIRTGRLAT
ncbi:MAG: ATP-binding protein [Flavobacteriales bacterium]